jgi:hypothetical protein
MPAFPPEAFAEVFSGPELPTVIGGQAVYHWAERFFNKAPELAAFGPFVSRDGDLWATRNTAIALRDRTGWNCKLFDEPRTHAVAILTKEFPGQDPLRIEVLKDVLGLTPMDLEYSTVITTAAGRQVRLLDPSVLLKGKISTLFHLGVTQRPTDERHIRLLIPITRAFLNERIQATRQSLTAEKPLLGALRYAIDVGKSDQARVLAKQFGYDFAAVMPTIEDFARLPRLARFVELELPRILPNRDRGSIEREIE